MDLMPVIASISVFWLLPLALYFRMMKKAGVTFELHAYQHDFLTAMASSSLPAVEAVTEKHGVTGATAALQVLAGGSRRLKGTSEDVRHLPVRTLRKQKPGFGSRIARAKRSPTRFPSRSKSQLSRHGAPRAGRKLGPPCARWWRAHENNPTRLLGSPSIGYPEYGALEDGKPKTKSAAKSPRAAKSPSKRR